MGVAQANFTSGFRRKEEQIWGIDFLCNTSCWLNTPNLQRVYNDYVLIVLLTLFLQKPPIPF